MPRPTPLNNRRKALVFSLGIAAGLAGWFLMGAGDKEQAKPLQLGGQVLFLGGIVLVACALDKRTKEEREAHRKKVDEVLFGIKPGVNRVHHAFKQLPWLVFILGTLILSKFAQQYRLLDDRINALFFWSIPIFFLPWCFFCIRESAKSPLMTICGPPSTRAFYIVASAGAAMLTAMLSFGSIEFYNGFKDRTEESRQVRWISKRTARSRDGTQYYYVKIRPWENSGQERELSVSSTDYNRLQPGTSIRLILGKGALGLEWIREVRFISSSVNDVGGAVR